jgi:hypothetical protein
MAKRLTSADRFNKGDRIRLTVRSSLDGELSAENWQVVRTSQKKGFQRVFLVRAGSRPLPGRGGSFEDDWPAAAGFHFFDTNMLPTYEEPIGKRGGYELLDPELRWAGDATSGQAVAYATEGRYVIERSYHEGKLVGYTVSYGVGSLLEELICKSTIAEAKSFALDDALTHSRVP